MAIDEALLRHFDPAVSLPVLRLYGWEPAALSIGRFQKADKLNLDHCRERRLPVVRRITGGGAILHADELTYSLVCAPCQIPPAASIKDSFRLLTGFLLDFYRSLGLRASYAVDCAFDGVRLGERTPFCFAGRESYDIFVDGRKIGGNAQRRLREVIFQHGSIPLLDRLKEGSACLRDVPPDIAERVTCLELEGVRQDVRQLKKRLADCFGRCLGVHLVAEDLSLKEQETAKRLTNEKYSSPLWNLQGDEP